MPRRICWSPPRHTPRCRRGLFIFTVLPTPTYVVAAEHRHMFTMFHDTGSEAYSCHHVLVDAKRMITISERFVEGVVAAKRYRARQPTPRLPDAATATFAAFAAVDAPDAVRRFTADGYARHNALPLLDASHRPVLRQFFHQATDAAAMRRRLSGLFRHHVADAVVIAVVPPQTSAVRRRVLPRLRLHAPPTMPHRAITVRRRFIGDATRFMRCGERQRCERGEKR